jgi:outer membrane protein OmpA-like peptidoglycan-associated protein
MAQRIKPQAKAFLVIIGILIVVFGFRAAMQHGLIPTPGILKSVVASKVNLPKQEDAKVQGVAPLPYPSSSPAHVSANALNIEEWEWDAQNDEHLANGGPDTTKGSLMEKYGVNLHIARQDSNDQMKKDLLSCAKQLHDGDQTCSSGAEGILVMGDSGGQWLADLNPQLAKLGMKLKIVGATGRSNGEDALLGPAEWKDNPRLMLGKTIVGVIRDGDWNIALAFEGFNNLKNNPDLTTYDPDAVNWISAPDDDYIKAVTEVYNQHKCESRKEVKDGHLDGKTVQVCPDGVVTWTPGDEQAVHGVPGTAKIISSKEYSAQMPDVLLILDKFANNNRDEIAGFWAATWTAADQIKAYDAALMKACEISAKIYNDQDANYWFNYSKGIRDKATGQPLGGSAVFNLQDNLQYFGLAEGYQNNMKATYETFARIDMEQYPSLFDPKKNPIPTYMEAVDTSYIRAAQDLLTNAGSQSAPAETVDYTSEVQTGSQVSKAALYISFATGSAQLTPEGQEQLKQLAENLGIAKSLALQLDGYTDNTGSDTVNIPLSHARAEAVKAYLQQVAPRDFPNSRFKSVEGHGSQNPIVPNDTPADKQKNRRVEIIQIGDNN